MHTDLDGASSELNWLAGRYWQKPKQRAKIESNPRIVIRNFYQTWAHSLPWDSQKTEFLLKPCMHLLTHHIIEWVHVASFSNLKGIRIFFYIFKPKTKRNDQKAKGWCPRSWKASVFVRDDEWPDCRAKDADKTVGEQGGRRWSEP